MNISFSIIAQAILEAQHSQIEGLQLTQLREWRSPQPRQLFPYTQPNNSPTPYTRFGGKQ